MKTGRGPVWLMRFIAIAVALTLAALLFKHFGSTFLVAKPSADGAKAQIQKILAADKQLLMRGDAPPSQIQKSLDRLSLKHDQDTKELLKKYIDHPDPTVQAAAAEAAGSFLNDGLRPLINESLKSDREAVRLGALRALARESGVENETAVLNFLKSPNLSHADFLQAHLTLVKIAGVASARAKSLQKILKELKIDENGVIQSHGSVAPVSNANANLDAEVLLELFLAAPSEPLLMNLAKQILAGNGPSGELKARAIQYLVANEKDALRAQLEAMEVPPNYQVQIALLDAMRAFCPQESLGLKSKLVGATTFQDVKIAAEKFACGK